MHVTVSRFWYSLKSSIMNLTYDFIFRKFFALVIIIFCNFSIFSLSVLHLFISCLSVVIISMSSIIFSIRKNLKYFFYSTTYKKAKFINHVTLINLLATAPIKQLNDPNMHDDKKCYVLQWKDIRRCNEV